MNLIKRNSWPNFLIITECKIKRILNTTQITLTLPIASLRVYLFNNINRVCCLTQIIIKDSSRCNFFNNLRVPSFQLMKQNSKSPSHLIKATCLNSMLPHLAKTPTTPTIKHNIWVQQVLILIISCLFKMDNNRIQVITSCLTPLFKDHKIRNWFLNKIT
jgi:hypothetical protein